MVSEKNKALVQYSKAGRKDWWFFGAGRRTTAMAGEIDLPTDHLAVTAALPCRDFNLPINGVLSLLLRLDFDTFSSRMEPDRILANNSLDMVNLIVPLHCCCCSCCCRESAWRRRGACGSSLLLDSFLGKGRRKYVSPGVSIVWGGKILPSCKSKRELEWQTKWPGYSWSKSATSMGL